MEKNDEKKIVNNNEIGFDTIYEGHSRRTWANFWYPLMTSSLCTMTSMVLTVLPVITTARPGMHNLVDNNKNNYIRCFQMYK